MSFQRPEPAQKRCWGGKVIADLSGVVGNSTVKGHTHSLPAVIKEGLFFEV